MAKITITVLTALLLTACATKSDFADRRAEYVQRYQVDKARCLASNGVILTDSHMNREPPVNGTRYWCRH